MDEDPNILAPSPHGGDGRGGNGRFLPGNRHGKGNPLAGASARLRAALLKQVKTSDIKAIADKLVALAKSGDLAAIKELLNRVVGLPVAQDIEERLQQLEEAMKDQAK